MINSVLRVYHEYFDPDDFCAQYDLEPSTIFRRGERHRGKEIIEAGCNIPISDEDDWKANLDDIMTFISNHDAALKCLKDKSIEPTIDIGVSVGSSDSYTKSINFKANKLDILSKYNIELAVSSYPLSNED